MADQPLAPDVRALWQHQVTGRGRQVSKGNPK